MRARRAFLRLMLMTMIILAGMFGVKNSYAEQAARPSVAAYVVIDGSIGPATDEFIQRAFSSAQAMQANVIILQIDTPGGLSKSMRGIIQTILRSPIPVISYVAPSGARAASAGTYILYASHLAAMAPGTNLGAATPIALGGMPSPQSGKDKKPQAPSAAEKKAVNDAKAYIRSLAQLRGRNVVWAEAAVDRGESLSAQEALKKGVINFIAQDVQAVLQKANGRRVMVQGQAMTVQTANLTVQRIDPDWRARFLAVITDPSVAYILLMLGIYGLFFEFLNPGFVAPGVIGGIALLLGFYALQLLPVNYAGVGLIFLGIAFIVAEAFLPSFGILGIGGVVSFVVGSIILFPAHTIGFTLPIYIVVGVTIATGLFFIVSLQLAIRSRRKPVVSGGSQMVGQTAVVFMEHGQPWVKINGERWRVVSKTPLSSGQQVVVASLKGLTLCVKPMSSSKE